MPERILLGADKFNRLLDYMQRIGLDAEIVQAHTK